MAPVRESLSRRGVVQGLAGLALAGCRRSLRPVNWGSWQGHVESQWLTQFQRRTGVAVNPIGIGDNTENLLRVKLGGPGTFDLMEADGLWARKFYEAGLIEPIDLDTVPTAKKNLYPEFLSAAGVQEGSKVLQVNWGWSPWILAFNKRRVDPPPTSWRVMWDPKYKGKVIMYTGTRPLIVAALVLGFPPWDMNADQLAKATALLIELKRNLLKFNAETLDVQTMLRDEAAWLALEASPGRVAKIHRAGGPEIGWTIPQEGTFGWVDGDMLIKGAPNRAASLELLDFIHQPGYVAQNMKRVPRGCCSRAAVEMLLDQGEKALVEENLMDKPEMFARMQIDRAPVDLDAYANAWSRVMAG
jgi:spermidine/putrescine-binding protein